MLRAVQENGADSGSDREDNNNEEEDDGLESWAKIQQSTFLNWINDKIRVFDLSCNNLRHDLKDGVILCRLMKVLRNEDIGRVKVKKRMSQIESSGNLALALQAMKQDGVRLVNIGPSDITGGNIKLILGLMWSLIRHYQIGSQSKLPPKKLMLSWINAILHPHRHVTNFSSDWNDGIALYGVIEFCKPGTFPRWYQSNASDRLENCESGMRTAQSLFDIPLVVTPRNLSSRDLDELSGMTYLSYFMSEGSPGFKATLHWVKQQISSTPVDNFDKDWNNGYVLSSLVHSLGGVIPGWPNFNTSDWIGTLTIAIDVSQSQLGVEPILSAKDMIHENVDHIGVMAYAAWHTHVGRTDEPPEAPPPTVQPPPVFIPPPPSPSPPPREPTPPPREPTPPPPESPVPPPVPVEVVALAPVVVEPPREEKVYVHFLKQWRINALHTIVVNTESLGDVQVKAKAYSPDDRTLDLTISQTDDFIHYINFLPTQKGRWHIEILYTEVVIEKQIEGSPYVIDVYDVTKVQLDRDEERNTLSLGNEYAFAVHCHECGLADIDAFVLYDGETMEHKIQSMDNTSFRVSFRGDELGTYTVALYCGGQEIKGSAFDIQCKDLSTIEVSGAGLHAARIGHDTNFIVDYSQGEFGHVSVKMTSPNGDDIITPVRVKDRGIAEVTYNPPVPGEYIINVYYDKILLKGSPYTVDVGNKKVYLRDIKSVSYVGQQDIFIVDASAAGKGQLEIDSDLPIREYNTIGERLYSISYVPKKTGKHDLTVKYNSIVVEGCPCTIDVQNKVETAPNGDVAPVNGDVTHVTDADSGEVT